jgi:hypothetical protein
MFTTDFSTRKFIECEYRIKYDIHDCTECDIAFECEEHYNSYYVPEQELFERLGYILMPTSAKTFNY